MWNVPTDPIGLRRSPPRSLFCSAIYYYYFFFFLNIFPLRFPRRVSVARSPLRRAMTRPPGLRVRGFNPARRRRTRFSAAAPAAPATPPPPVDFHRRRSCRREKGSRALVFFPPFFFFFRSGGRPRARYYAYETLLPTPSPVVHRADIISRLQHARNRSRVHTCSGAVR